MNEEAKKLHDELMNQFQELMDLMDNQQYCDTKVTDAMVQQQLGATFYVYKKMVEAQERGD